MFAADECGCRREYLDVVVDKSDASVREAVTSASPAAPPPPVDGLEGAVTLVVEEGAEPAPRDQQGPKEAG